MSGVVTAKVLGVILAARLGLQHLHELLDVIVIECEGHLLSLLALLVYLVL